ncbi:HSF-type DNA-binding domain-containing protein [Hirsutella rhossiliensis]|uniref:HSF-type DNA-binding domain-containing protein n=1 Tax=Hirsutella rhossiliensis TaxID=111463 RepID=A0A9P8SFH0_9HYPO|nr:HSF-type DNA-binding domain-containing protein [Hirsutella rhossiliensis]KAH0960736.1 HSF-type DNA-binding domain-containing protein [Hirsutella rhossiliensis]
MSAGGDAMDITSPARLTTSIHISDPETNGKPAARSNHSSPPDQTSPHSSSSINMPAPPPAAAAAVHQPKIVQTAFIHKLYNMLEDSSIQHLISWSANAESFVMSPSADFSKVLSQYFKHTNISSFVRQLNMYGFHKERDVFHTGNPDTTLWEFKHGNGNFKRGDLMGLREIKRRASRHALVHRESNYNKPNPSQQGPPTEPAQITAESSEARLANLEHSLFDMSARLQRSEENAHFMNIKNQAAMETMSRLLQFNQDLSRAVLSLVPADSPVHRDVLALQGEMHRQADVLRTFDETHEGPYGARQQYLGTVDNAPVSPRQLPQDDARRSANLTVPQPRGQPLYRPAVPPSVLASARRPYGSIGGSSTTQSSPLRNANPAPPPGPHPLSNVEPPPGSLARRHTAADIRAHGWQPTPSPFSTSNPPSAPWPSSPSPSHPHPQSRPATPPPPLPPPSHGANGGNNGSDAFGSWSWNSAANRDAKSLAIRDSSAPPTRRGSMAHILNPSDTAERSDEDEDPRGDDDRKRKRLQ